jgi:hypothetical protein
LPESQSALVARTGSEFAITDRDDGWLRVEDSADREGWLTSDRVIDPAARRQSGPVAKAEPRHFGNVFNKDELPPAGESIAAFQIVPQQNRATTRLIR